MSYADIGTARVRAMNLHALDAQQRHRYGDPPWTDFRPGNRGNPSTIGAATGGLADSVTNSITNTFASARATLTTPIIPRQPFSTPLVVLLATGLGYFLIKKA